MADAPEESRNSHVWIDQYDVELVNAPSSNENKSTPAKTEYGNHGEKIIKSVIPGNYGLPQYDRFLFQPILMSDGTKSFALWGESKSKTESGDSSFTMLFGPGWEPRLGNEISLMKDEDELKKLLDDVSTKVWERIDFYREWGEEIVRSEKEMAEEREALKLEKKQRLGLYPQAEDEFVGPRFKELIPVDLLVRERTKILTGGKTEKGIRDNPLVPDEYYIYGMNRKHIEESRKAERNLIIRSTTAQTRRIEKQVRGLIPGSDE